MQLLIKTAGRERLVNHFLVQQIDQAKAIGRELCMMSWTSGEPAEMRIKDGMGVVVLKLIAPIGWHVPLGALGYEWVI